MAEFHGGEKTRWGSPWVATLPFCYKLWCNTGEKYSQDHPLSGNSQEKKSPLFVICWEVIKREAILWLSPNDLAFHEHSGLTTLYQSENRNGTIHSVYRWVILAIY